MRTSPTPALILSLLLGCGTDPAPKPAGVAGGGTGDAGVSDSGGQPDPREALRVAAPASAHTERVATGDVCAECHANSDDADAMRLSDGTPVSPVDLQAASVMANAGRDPVFFAVLAAEIAQAPGRASDIEGVCFRCHAPLARAEAEALGAPLPSAVELRGGEGELATLGREGVGCVACHRMADDGLETPERWTGLFSLDADGRVFGPHAEPFTHPMEMHTGWTPAAADHVADSRLCASCHTLQTHTLVDGDFGEQTFLEQATWLEWRASAYADGGERAQDCQGCHLPTTEPDGTPISTAIARRPDGGDFPPIDVRQPYGRHDMVGGNTLLLSLLRDHADVLQPRADGAAFDAAIAGSRALLGGAAALEVVGVARVGEGIQADIRVENRSGHKLPTGYPARRAWLRVRVLDADGAVAFAVGEVDARGRIVGADGAPLPAELAGGPAPLHVSEVGPGGPPAIYGVTMQDAAGAPTWRLLRAATLARDTRLLPHGWDPAAAETAVGSLAPVGVSGDGDFGAGGDTVRLSLATLSGPAPHRLEASLLYQPLAPRYLAELRRVDLPEVQALDAMLVDASWEPEVLASWVQTVP